MASAVIGALRVDLSANTAEFKRNLNTAETMANRFGRSIGTTIRRQLLAFAAAAAAAAGPAALMALTKSSMDTIDAQAKLAARTGASVAAIQTLQHAAELAGVGQEALAKTLGTLNTRLGEAARTGAGPAYEALKRLGLSARELSQMDADERIKALSDAMKEAGYSTQQMSDTLKNLGVRNQEINNLFIEGSAAITRARTDLTAWGVALSDVDAKKVEDANDAISRIATVLSGLGNQLAIRLAKPLEEIAEKFTDAARATGGFGDAMDTAISRGGRLLEAMNVTLKATVKEYNALADVFERVENLRNGVVDVEEIPGENRAVSGAELRGEFTMTGDGKTDREPTAVPPKPTKPTKPGGGLTEAQQRAADELKAQLAQRLETLVGSLETEREAEMAAYAQRLTDLQEFSANRLLTEQQTADLRARIEQDHAAKIKDIDDDIVKNRARDAEKQRQIMFGVAAEIGSALQRIFGESKVVAIAQSIINTAQAVTRNLAEYPGPFGFAAAAAAAAAGAAQIAAIRKTTSKGGGGGSPVSSGGAPSASGAPPPGSNQTLYINGLNTNSLFSGESVRELAAKLIEFQRDGGKIVLAAA